MSPPALAGAPISWGVSEVPGWGHQMPAGRVLAEMRACGLRATELGPPGFLPGDPRALTALLDRHGLRLAAGFLAVVLHDPGRRPAALGALEATARTLAAAGAGVLVLAAASTTAGYDRRDRLDDAGWSALAESIEAAGAIADRHGLTLAVHPHVGTVVERHDEIRRLLDQTGAGICLDTGHLVVAGVDPARVAAEAGARVRHVHLKDVDAALARRVREGEVAFAEAVRRGLFRPLGAGDVDVPDLLRCLESARFGGWCVLEQDRVLAGDPPDGEGPALDVRRGVAYWKEMEGVNR